MHSHAGAMGTRKKSEKHSFVILVSRSPEYNEGDNEGCDIIEILRRSALQDDTVWTFYEGIFFSPGAFFYLTTQKKCCRACTFCDKYLID